MVTDPEKLYENCRLCPRECGVNRFKSEGVCRMGVPIRAARASLHRWEEPCISGQRGSGAVFFSGCALSCLFCQNEPISRGRIGKEITSERLGEIFLELQSRGAENINLVTATHFLPGVIRALSAVKSRLSVPVVWNCSGFESVESIRLLKEYVDIWLPDLKYFDGTLAMQFSRVPHYFETAVEAIGEMISLAGPPVFGETDGLLRRGVLIRHLVLPGHRDDSKQILNEISARFSPDTYLISLLSQYTPFGDALSDSRFPELQRRLTTFEYEDVVRHARSLGMNGYLQARSSANAEYTPVFDFTGRG